MEVLRNQEGKIIRAEEVAQGEFTPIYLEHLKKVPGDLYTIRSTHPIYSYLFKISNTGIVSPYESLEFDNVIDRMIRYSSSLWNDFYETTRFLPWIRKQALFFEYAFFTSDLFVHWDAEEEEYLFFIKLSETTFDEDEGKEKDKYLNIETNLVHTFKDPDTDLVKYSWNGRKENRFRQWFRLAYQMELREYIYTTQCILWNKKLLIKADGYMNANAESLEAVKKDLVNLAPFLNKTDHQSLIDFMETPLVTAVEIDAFLGGCYKWFDREISEFGRVANLNPKPERKTAGENFIAIDRQVDHLRSIQDHLDLLAGDMKERGWPPISFKVNTEDSLGMIAEPEGDQMPTQSDATEPK